MFEKIKDFLYDISDIFLSLLIIGLIFFAVSWKISDTLSIDIDGPSTTVESEETTEGTSIIVTPVTPTEATVETSEGETSVGDTTENTTETSTEASTEAPTQPTTEAGVLEKFVVNDGELGNTIGKHLEEQGFVKNSNDFVKRLIEMGFDSKLRAGTFKISKTDSLDTIIKVLAGQGR